MARVKLLTPLVLGTTLVVLGFGAVNIFLVPDRLWVWLLGMLFLPIAIIGLIFLTKTKGSHRRAIGLGGGLRAGLVGAGVLLATTFGFSATDTMGWTGAKGQFSGQPLMLFLLPTIAILADVLGARLEQAAAREIISDEDGAD